MNLIRSISGIRGIVGKTIDTSTVELYCNAFANIQSPGKIAIARDGRDPGKNLYISAIEALTANKRKVILLDIAPTPTVQYITKKYDLAGAVIITASHNPQGWNGIKLVDEKGIFINNKKFAEICKEVDRNNQLKSVHAENFSFIKKNFKYIYEHIHDTLKLSYINKEKIQKKKFRVSVDAVNSSCSNAIPSLLKELGCETSIINCLANGKFTRSPEPLPENLKALSKDVINNKSDFGLAFDPDGDRLSIVDNNGVAIGEEYTLPICAWGYYQLTNSRSPIVTNLSTSMLVQSIAKKFNVKVIQTKIGEINVVNKMIELNAEFGGEGNGGVILNDSHLGRDAIVATTLLIATLSELNIKLSEIIKMLPKFFIVKDKIENDKISIESLLDPISNSFKKSPCSISTEDGIKVIFLENEDNEGAWVHVRKSNTEPIYRIYSESTSLKKSKSLIKKIKQIINSN